MAYMEVVGNSPLDTGNDSTRCQKLTNKLRSRVGSWSVGADGISTANSFRYPQLHTCRALSRSAHRFIVAVSSFARETWRWTDIFSPRHSPPQGLRCTFVPYVRNPSTKVLPGTSSPPIDSRPASFLTSNLIETSRTRHLQYCRRRGERNQSSRPRACHSCRRTKSKCDFARPCSRCAGKGLECSYGTYRSATTSGPVTFNATIPRSSSGVGTPGLITGISPRIFNDASIHPSLMTQEDDAGFILPLDSYGANAVDSSRDNTRPALGDNMLSTATLPSDEEISSLPLLSSPTLDGINAFLFAEEGPPHALISSTPLAARDPHDAPTDVLSLVPVPDRTIGVPPRPCSRRISKGCRRFILSIIRTYPSMMAASGNLPPYVHPVGCGLHFDGQDPELRSAETAVFAPLKPLAACYGIAQVFASRVPNTSEFLWRAVEKEHSLIRDEVGCLAAGGDAP